MNVFAAEFGCVIWGFGRNDMCEVCEVCLQLHERNKEINSFYASFNI